MKEDKTSKPTPKRTPKADESPEASTAEKLILILVGVAVAGGLVWWIFKVLPAALSK